jgi:hypothetical protein
MNEATIRGEIIRMLRKTGSLAITSVNFQYVGNGGKPIVGKTNNPVKYPLDGLPDIIYFRGAKTENPAGFIEVKYSKESFAFSSWRENQRNWVKVWGHTGCTWLVICFDVGRKTHQSGRQAFLLPTELVLQTEQQFAEHNLSSIPLSGNTSRIICRDPEKDERGQGLNAVKLWSDYILDWRNGLWAIPQNHLFNT